MAQSKSGPEPESALESKWKRRLCGRKLSSPKYIGIKVPLSSWDRSHQNANVGFENANVGIGEQYRDRLLGAGERAPGQDVGAEWGAGMKGAKEVREPERRKQQESIEVERLLGRPGKGEC